MICFVFTIFLLISIFYFLSFSGGGASNNNIAVPTSEADSEENLERANRISEESTDEPISKQDQSSKFYDVISSHHTADSEESKLNEAKRRRKSPPVQIKQSKESEERPNSALFDDNLEPTAKRLGLSLKSPLDLELRISADESSSPPASAANTEDNKPNPSNGFQAALAAWQTTQETLNQLSMQLVAMGANQNAPGLFQSQLAAVAARQLNSQQTADRNSSAGPAAASSTSPNLSQPQLPNLASLPQQPNAPNPNDIQAIKQALQQQQQNIQQHLQNILLLQQSSIGNMAAAAAANNNVPPPLIGNQVSY